MTNAEKLDEYNELKKIFSDLENFEQYFPEEMPKDLDVEKLGDQLSAAWRVQHKERYNKVLNYLQRTVKLNWFGEVIVPTVLLTSEGLKLPSQEVGEIYQEMLERGILCEVSQYGYTVGSFFPLTDDIKQRIGTVSSRR